ncbi:MAG TPA: Lsr2 family protein [Actinocrinis sp.]|nr:Lsr2 family protein [Actinocrinis sp.]
MAQYTVVHMKDDLDGSEAQQTIYFSLDNKDYVIDLNDKNAEALRTQLTRYIEAGRKHDAVAQAAKPRRAARGAAAAVDPAVVREWARENGHEVSDRGRVSLNLIKAYHEAH